MKLKDTEKSMLLVLAGVAALVLSFMYIIKPNYQSTQALKAECVTLSQKLYDLQQKQAKREMYVAETEKYNSAFDEIIAKFPADLNQEITIMFLQGIKDNNDFDVKTLSLGKQEQYYTLGSNGGAATIPDAAPTDGTAPIDETALTETAAPTTEPYVCYRAAFPISYTGSYESLKDVVAYIDNFVSRMTVDQIDIRYDAGADLYSGSLNLMCYAIEGEDRPKSNLELNEVETGVDNIFLGGEGNSNSVTATMTKYDENEGAAIETSYDFYAMLNPASSDVSAKVIGQNGTGKEASVISNSDNTVSILSFDFYEVDGKNYCKYTLDNSTSYEAEITSAEDVKLLLQSSARKDTDDKAGVRITIRNSTSLPVYVKVTGDDAVTPRVQIVSKIGAVKVY